MNRWFTSKQPDYNHFDGFPIYLNKCALWYLILLKYPMILKRPMKRRLRDLSGRASSGGFSDIIAVFQPALFKSKIQAHFPGLDS